MLIEQINGIDFEPLERSLSNLLDMLWSAIQANLGLGPSLGSFLNPNLVAITTFPRKGASASPNNSSFVNGP